MRESLAGVLVVLASASLASAETGAVATPGAPHAPSPLAWDARVGFLAGATEVGDTGGASIGLSTAIAIRRGDVALRGLFDYYRVGDSGDSATRHGKGMRYGGALRYSFLATRKSALADFWGEAGGGIEHVEWRGGGVVDRPSGELAFGVDVGARYDAARRAGTFFAIRTFVAPPPPSQAMATCTGPCDRATKPGADFTTFFELGFHWGR